MKTREAVLGWVGLAARLRRRPSLSMEALSRLGAAALERAGAALLPAYLKELLALHAIWATSARDVLLALGFSDNEVAALLEEYESVAGNLRSEIARASLRYPSDFRIEEETQRLLYVLVRARQPQLVVETGVADGMSTRLITEGLTRNQHGLLHSCDVLDDVGALVLNHPTARRLKLHILPWPYGRHLDRLCATLSPVDIFIHDSNHQYHNARYEYEVAWKFLRAGGLLVSDDVDAANAFAHVCKIHHIAPIILVDKRKAVGIATKPK